MVKSITNFGRSGLSDWLIQRVSAVIMAAFTVFMVSVLLTGDINFQTWSALFDKEWVKIFTLLTVLSVAAHAWIGLWIVATDYIKSILLRFIFSVSVALTLFVFVVTAITALWGA